MQGLTLGLRLQLRTPCTCGATQGQARTTTHAATTLLSLLTFLDHVIYGEYPATWCLKITLTGWYTHIPCSLPEDTCCMVCIDKPNQHKSFYGLINVIKILFLNGRYGQGIKDITRDINKPKMTLKTFYIPLLLKSIECMDTIHVVQFLYYEPMMWILCLKPSFVCSKKPSLYSRNIDGILIKLIFLGTAFLSIIITILSLPGFFA